MGSADRQKLLEPADHFLNWAVGLDVEKRLSKHGVSLDPDHLLSAGSRNLPTEMLNGLTDTQRTLGEGLFRSASAFILLHELGHLKLQHPASTIENEKDADRFAAEWMTNDDMQPRNDPFSDRIVAIYGIAVALLWLTVLNIFMGPSNGSTHPQAYDRLFQVLDQVVDFTNDDEQQLVWEFVSTILFIHMYSAGFDFDPQRGAIHMQGDASDEVNYLINRIANRDVKR